MQKIIPNLWFDNEAKQAAELYTSTFKDSRVTEITTLHNTPSGDTDIVSFVLSGQSFMAINAGPLFKFNPSISFHVKCETKDEVDAIWEKLSEGGMVLIELGEYPFSEKYGWLKDKYGISWQVIFTGQGEIKQKITPVLTYVGDVCGKAEEAVNFYVSMFQNARVDALLRYGKSEEPDNEGTLKYAAFTLEGEEFGAMDSAHKHPFAFNEAISFMIYCETQEEIDYYWDKLTAIPEAEQCGWLKDKYGLSWQVVPTIMDMMMRNGNQEKIDRLTQAFLPMKKLDIARLQEAYEGK
jgi:predicted 3-demethylubiquinone-9 3-methyltransferase (glyoxalase superfamily)